MNNLFKALKVMHAFLLRYKLSFFRYTSLANLFNS